MLGHKDYRGGRNGAERADTGSQGQTSNFLLKLSGCGVPPEPGANLPAKMFAIILKVLYCIQRLLATNGGTPRKHLASRKQIQEIAQDSEKEPFSNVCLSLGRHSISL